MAAASCSRVGSSMPAADTQECCMHDPNVTTQEPVLELSAARSASVITCAEKWVETAKLPQSVIARRILSDSAAATQDGKVGDAMYYAHPSCRNNFLNVYRISRARKRHHGLLEVR